MINTALKLVRKYHDIKQKELAGRLDISPSYLSEIESGTKPVTYEILEQYSKTFRIPVSSLLYFAEKKDGLIGAEANPIAEKALKMLDWVATIAEDEKHDEAALRH